MILAIPLWIWIGAAIAAVPLLALIAVVVAETTAAKPLWSRRIRGTRFELWSTGRVLPRRTDLVVVPVSPELKLIAGAALWVRGVTAGAAQRDADRHAPARPGTAVLVSGARYRFHRAALAVVMDSEKRYADEWVRAALQSAVAQARNEGLSSLTVLDWLDDLGRQPRLQDATYRRKTAEELAPLMADALLALAGEVPVVRLWVRHPDAADVYRDALAACAESAQAVRA